MMKTIYCCDRCGEEIKDVAYILTCYAEPIPSSDPVKNFLDLAAQNIRQNTALGNDQSRHLCRKCKDEITDGIFIV